MGDALVSVVGGMVRDALLGVEESEDVDLVVEGDAIGLATRLGQALSCRVVTHGRFGTAYLELPHERWIDVVTARRERYPAPGALPEVDAGTLADDLARRDFTINAMAYRLTGPQAGTLVDPLGGRSDLAAGIIRVMHPGSFVDDPSRVLRAARYGARFGFGLDPVTAGAAHDAARELDAGSARVGDELRRMLDEPARVAAAAVSRAAALGVPWLDGGPGLTDRFLALDRMLERDGAPRIDPWALRLGLAVDRGALPRVAVDGWARGIADATADGDRLAAVLTEAERPSERDRLLASAKPAAAVAAAAAGAEVVPEWWSGARTFRLEVSGEDLVRAGIAPSPAIGRALAAVRAAVLDGAVGDDPREQLAFALAHARGTA